MSVRDRRKQGHRHWPTIWLFVLVSVGRSHAAMVHPSQVEAVRDLISGAGGDPGTADSLDCSGLGALVQGATLAVECDYQGYVVSLRLNGSSLLHVPNSVSLLTSLVSLDLRHNALWGPIPGSTLAGLFQLRFLDMAGNSLSEPIPEELSSLSVLTSLSLAGNRLSGEIPGFFSSLTDLIYLQLQYNSELQGTIPAVWSTLTKLSALDLSTNQITGTIPDELSHLTGLVYLAASRNQLGGALPPWLGSAWPELRFLYLQGNRLTGTIPEGWGAASNLESLSLDHNRLSGSLPRSLAQMLSLKALYLNGNALEGGVPGTLSSLGRLQFLDLSDNPGLGGSLPNSLGSLQSLQSLVLSRCGLSGSLPPSLGSLGSLRELYVRGNLLTGPIPEEWGGLRSLTGLFLANNGLSGTLQGDTPGVRPPLCSLTALQVADLANNSLGGAIPPCLTTLPSLSFLSLSGNRFSGKPPVASSSLLFLYSRNCLDVNDHQRPASDPACAPGAHSAPQSPNAPTFASDLAAPPHPAVAASWQPDASPPPTLPGASAPPAGTKPSSPRSSSQSSSSSSSFTWLWALLWAFLALLLAGILLGLGFVALSTVRRRWQQGPTKRPPPDQGGDAAVAEYGLSKIKKATKNFSTVLGRGSFGSAFLAEEFLRDAAETRAVAKRAHDPLSLGEFEFRSKVEQLARARHPCCVSLLGYCAGKGERILVFEYLPNGTLFDRLHRPEVEPLPWEARVRVAVNVACALEFLHSSSPPMVHRAVTSSNILLAADMSAKLSDYGLARGATGSVELAPRKRRPARILREQRQASDAAVGAVDGGGSDVESGSTAPRPQPPPPPPPAEERPLGPEEPRQQAATGVSSLEKVDVYGFGVVLLELITGQKAMKDVHITTLAAPFIEDAQMMPLMVDAALGGYFNQEELIVLGSIARDCVKEDPSSRPSMRQVVATMESQLNIDIQLYHSHGEATAGIHTAAANGAGGGYLSLLEQPNGASPRGVAGAAFSAVSSVASSLQSLLTGMRTSSQPSTPGSSTGGNGFFRSGSTDGGRDAGSGSSLLFITPRGGR